MPPLQRIPGFIQLGDLLAIKAYNRGMKPPTLSFLMLPALLFTASADPGNKLANNL